MSVTLDDITAARTRIRDGIYHTPCPYSLSLSRLCNAKIYCKLDHLQMTGSFKERLAASKLRELNPQQRAAKGVIAASAGNHALGLAYHGQQLGIPVTVLMPRWSPLVKVQNCRSFGADVVIFGASFDEAYREAKRLSAENGLLFVPGFDDPDIIAGQGTLGLEILEDVPDVDVVIIPVGGGGLVAGVGLAIKALRPNVRIVAVEAEHAPTLRASLDAGQVVHVTTRPTLADGLGVAAVGQLPFEIAQRVIDQLLLVSEAEIAASVLRLLELEKMVIEAAGAVTLAVAARKPSGFEGKKVVLLLSGGNIDVTMIARIIERGLATEGRLFRILARISDRPGSLAQLATLLGAARASIKEVAHDRTFSPVDFGGVAVACVLETRDFDHIRQIETALHEAKIDFSRG